MEGEDPPVFPKLRPSERPTPDRPWPHFPSAQPATGLFHSSFDPVSNAKLCCNLKQAGVL